ncbi:MAG: phytanoyl-CoA dioxygenase family protein, partial [Alphaproteobacteria bacterium]
ERFRRDGFVVVDPFFSAHEVAALQGGFEELLAAGKLANVATDFDRATRRDDKVNLQVCPLSYHHPLFAALPFHDKVRALVTELLGGPAYKFLDQIFYKPGRVGIGTNWHQDNHYFGVDDPFLGLGLWIAIHDANRANGALRVLPGYAARPIQHVPDPESDHHYRMYPPDDAEPVVLEVRAGAVIAFCFNTPHSTTRNDTDRGRAGLAYHFIRSGQVGVWHEEAVNPHAEFPLWGVEGKEHGPVISGATYSRGIGEYDRDMEQVLQAEIDRLAYGQPRHPAA